MTSRFLALRVRPANVKLRNRASRAGQEIPLCWLIREWSVDKKQPVKYWLSNLPEDTTIEDLVRLGKMRWRIEHDYRELKDALGLDHFEGRGYRGFNHHVTLVSVAHPFLTLERRRRDRRPPLKAAA
jgi:SRSO17 transposase